MAVLLEDLYFFDDRIVDLYEQSQIFQKEKRKECNEEINLNEGNYNFIEESEFLYVEECDENEKIEGSLKDNKENSFDKEDVFGEIQSDCSEKDSSTLKTQESWDFPVGAVPWDDNEKPIVRLLNYADLKLTSEEEKGLLTDRIVMACSSYLTQSPGDKCHILAKASLSHKNLNNIGILGSHRFLQYVDLSWNNLVDISPLGCIPYLMYLDVSHNLLENVLRFRPPLNLTYVNYSFNQVWKVDDLSDFWTLCYLDLSHNKISKIQGFHNLRYLRHLDLSHNNIERFENLNNLRITDLNLEYNLISKFEMDSGLGMNTMPSLTNVYLNNNLISSLEFLENVYHLKTLELQGNNISELAELTYMKRLKSLRHLDLSENLVSKQKPYRSLILNLLQELKFLDQTEVEISERVATCKIKKYDIQLEAAKHHSRMLLLEQLNDVSIDLDVFPVNHPFVILVGPCASSKKLITSCVGSKYPEKIYVAKLHTTRHVLDTEKELLQETSRENFEEMIKSGMFLCIYESVGHFYGFSREELGIAIKKRKLCITSMDIVGALTILSFNLRPFLILAIPESKEEHMRRLKLAYGPMLYKLGAAYIASREIVDIRDNNVKLVEIIIKQIIEEVWQKVNFKILQLPRDSELVFEYIRNTSKKTNKSIELSDSFSLNSYHSSSQKKKKSEDCYAYYNSSKNNTLEGEMKGEETSTSYSADDPPPFKLELFSEESICGESEPFANWSTPFIDWSEIDLDNFELEQASEVFCEKYLENVMSSRDVYINIHLENPGLFSLCIFTDDKKQAVKTLVKFLKEVWRTTGDRKPTFDPDKDNVYRAFIPRKLNHLKEILFSTNDSFGLCEKFPHSSSFECVAMKSKKF